MSYLDDDIITRKNMATFEEINCETGKITNISIINEYLEKIVNEEDRLKAIEYIKQLDYYDKIALILSIEILGSSFDLLKSNGYREWYGEWYYSYTKKNN
jgi:hypothetical protein